MEGAGNVRPFNRQKHWTFGLLWEPRSCQHIDTAHKGHSQKKELSAVAPNPNTNSMSRQEHCDGRAADGGQDQQHCWNTLKRFLCCTELECMSFRSES